ncbi:tnfaip3-interacting protein 1-like [Plakobranchus ocellatus]|uniref:Tnfaip3-interacting protein 1-like n=1 Tax=Plakobranchus ocellatus TaxID=259542 RepID=A0AAV3YKY4_9GAST|nr:tnfaip3-interacting protein 1-like [Plakobranchus ocellatus]
MEKKLSLKPEDNNLSPASYYVFQSSFSNGGNKLLPEKAEIQRLQVQLQQISEKNHPKLLAELREEIRHLKEENRVLQQSVSLAQGKQQRQAHQSFQNGAETEPGWVTVAKTLENNEETASLMLYPDSPLMKRIDELQNTNAKLFKANKDWHTKWEALRQSKQTEQEQLVSQLKDSEETNRRLKSEILSLENKLREEGEKVRNSKLKEKDAEIALLKNQLTLFMQDFEKEKKEKTVYKEQLRAKDSTKFHLEDKLQSLETELQVKDNQLKASLKQLEILQQKIVGLKNELREEKRKAAANRQLYQSGVPTAFYPSNAGKPYSTLSSSQFALGPRRGPEELPGAWTCPDCTYINYPDRTVCDICGLTKSLGAESLQYETGELQSRGNPQLNMGRNVPDRASDVEVDSA